MFLWNHSTSNIQQLRRRLGIVFQDFNLLMDRSVYQNLAFVLRATGWSSKSEMDKRISLVLKLVGLDEVIREKMPHEISGGEQQRVVIARALLNKPALIIADEPTGNLDIASGKEVMALFKELCHDEENPVSILMVTHDPDLASNADRMLLLRDGKTEASDIRSAWGLDAEEAPQGGEEE